MAQDDGWLDEIKWTEDGLVPAIAQDSESGRILMFAWMNRESLALTIAEQRAIYWSRSRSRLWRKGEESGHIQELKDIRLDCDSDVVLMSVKQIGGIACHTGHERCFFRHWVDGEWREDEPLVKDPNDIYGKG